MSIRARSSGPAIVLVWLCLSVAAPALAHTVLEESIPDNKANLEASPELISLTFKEPVVPIFVRLYETSDEDSIELGELEANGAVVSAAIDSVLAPGTYKVEFRVASKDAHVIEGSISFVVTDTATQN